MHPEQAKQSAKRAVTNRVGPLVVVVVVAAWMLVVSDDALVAVVVAVASRGRCRLRGTTTGAAAVGTVVVVVPRLAVVAAVLIVSWCSVAVVPANNGFTHAADGDTKSSTKFNTIALPNTVVLVLVE